MYIFILYIYICVFFAYLKTSLEGEQRRECCRPPPAPLEPPGEPHVVVVEPLEEPHGVVVEHLGVVARAFLNSLLDKYKVILAPPKHVLHLVSYKNKFVRL